MPLLLALALFSQLTPACVRDSLPRPLPCSSVARPLAADDRWLAMDKFWHFSASFVTVGAAYHLGANRARLSEPWPTSIALGGTFAVGVSKELCDLVGPGKHLSWKDLVADAAGVCAGYFAFIHNY